MEKQKTGWPDGWREWITLGNWWTLYLLAMCNDMDDPAGEADYWTTQIPFLPPIDWGFHKL